MGRAVVFVEGILKLGLGRPSMYHLGFVRHNSLIPANGINSWIHKLRRTIEHLSETLRVKPYLLVILMKNFG
jgi:hypothetical protein